jgi:biopolymer transport protein ExbD
VQNKRRDHHEIIADINITPFTDVVLVLLIIFLIATTVLMMEGIKVDLPGTKPQTTSENKDTYVTIKIFEDGSVFLDGEKRQMSELKPLLEQVIKLNPNSIIAIGGEPNAVYDRVVQVIDLARSAGVTRYVLVK